MDSSGSESDHKPTLSLPKNKHISLRQRTWNNLGKGLYLLFQESIEYNILLILVYYEEASFIMQWLPTTKLFIFCKGSEEYRQQLWLLSAMKGDKAVCKHVFDLMSASLIAWYFASVLWNHFSVWCLFSPLLSVKNCYKKYRFKWWNLSCESGFVFHTK